MKNKSLDLINGPILGTLSRLALPIMASSLLGTAYNITDMAWVGMLGSKAVAGVGVGGMYVWLSQGLSSLARMGGQVGAAQSCGKNKREDAICYSTAAIQLTVLFGLAFALICVVFTDSLLGFFQLSDAESYSSARIYTKITCGFIIFSYLNVTLTGLYTAQGDSKTPFFANLTGLVLNMIADPVLILGMGPFPRLEATGAAIATVSAQLVVLLVLILGIVRSAPENNLLKEVRIFSRPPRVFYASIFRIGTPTAIQGTLYCFISMCLTRMVSVFGPAAIAAQKVGGQIESLSWNTADGFSSALNAFMGQNYGAQKSHRIRKGYRTALALLIPWTLLITILFICFPRPVSSIFFHEAEAIEISVGYFMIVGLSECFMAVELMTVGALSGLGKTKLCSIISTLLTGARIPLALLFTALGLGISGIWWALSATSIVKGIVFYLTYRKVERTCI